LVQVARAFGLNPTRRQVGIAASAVFSLAAGVAAVRLISPPPADHPPAAAPQTLVAEAPKPAVVAAHPPAETVPAPKAFPADPHAIPLAPSHAPAPPRGGPSVSVELLPPPAYPVVPAYAATPAALPAIPASLPALPAVPPTPAVTPAAAPDPFRAVGSPAAALPPPAAFVMPVVASEAPKPAAVPPLPAFPDAPPAVTPAAPPLPMIPGVGPAAPPALPTAPATPAVLPPPGAVEPPAAPKPAPPAALPDLPAVPTFAPAVPLPVPAKVEGLPVTPAPMTPPAPSFAPPPAVTPLPTPDVTPVLTPTDRTPVGTKIEFTKPPAAAEAKPAGVTERAPQTSFDVDLHEPRAGETYETIGREFYNDARYGKALAEYNRRKPLQGGGHVEVPPMHVLKKRFPQLLGVVAPAGGTAAASPDEWGPVGGAGADTFRASGAKSFAVPPGGMSMRAVSRLTLGTENRWREVYDLNPQYAPDAVPAGTPLALPADAVLPK